MTVSVLDIGIGNIGSLTNALVKANLTFRRISSSQQLVDSDCLILPGVGSFDPAMKTLHELDLVAAIKEFVSLERPVLGICLGMQLMASSSEEGKLPGLNIIEGQVKRLHPSLISNSIKLPQIGWNQIHSSFYDPLFEGLKSASFYFAHSYYFSPRYDSDILCSSYYGQDYCSGVRRGNVYGLQFHPEVSHSDGLQILRNFYRLGNA